MNIILAISKEIRINSWNVGLICTFIWPTGEHDNWWSDYPKDWLIILNLTPFLKGFEILDVADVGDNLILDFHSSPEDGEYFDEWVEGSGWLSGMESLRSDILSGDLRALYLAWLAVFGSATSGF